MYSIGVEDVGLCVNGHCDDSVARQHLTSVAGGKVDIVTRIAGHKAKKGESFPVRFAWFKPSKFGRFASLPTDNDILAEFQLSKVQPLVFSEVVGMLEAMRVQHVQELLGITNHERRARCCGVRNGDCTKIGMIPLGSIAKVGSDGIDHLVLFHRDIAVNGTPKLIKAMNLSPLLVFPVRPIARTEQAVVSDKKKRPAKV